MIYENMRVIHCLFGRNLRPQSTSNEIYALKIQEIFTVLWANYICHLGTFPKPHHTGVIRGWHWSRVPGLIVGDPSVVHNNSTFIDEDGCFCLFSPVSDQWLGWKINIYSKNAMHMVLFVDEWSDSMFWPMAGTNPASPLNQNWRSGSLEDIGGLWVAG